MAKPADRTEDSRPAGAACSSYLDQLASIGRTYEHERRGSDDCRHGGGIVYMLVFLSGRDCQACRQPGFAAGG